jgi:cobalt-zinc-cadmium efflux system protein
VLRQGQGESLNVRAAYLDVITDLLGSVAVVVSTIVVLITGFVRADVIASLVIVAIIVPSLWTLLSEVSSVLMESVPRGVDLGDVRGHILSVADVEGLHDLHVWTLTSGMPVMSAHVVVSDAALKAGESARILSDLRQCLGHHFDVEHCTFQLEPPGHFAHESAVHS